MHGSVGRQQRRQGPLGIAQTYSSNNTKQQQMASSTRSMINQHSFFRFSPSAPNNPQPHIRIRQKQPPASPPAAARPFPAATEAVSAVTGDAGALAALARGGHAGLAVRAACVHNKQSTTAAAAAATRTGSRGGRCRWLLPASCSSFLQEQRQTAPAGRSQRQPPPSRSRCRARAAGRVVCCTHAAPAHSSPLQPQRVDGVIRGHAKVGYRTLSHRTKRESGHPTKAV